MTRSLGDFTRIVLKIGSALLVDRSKGQQRQAWLETLAQDIAWLHKAGAEVLVVSSGAVALGRTILRMTDGPLKLAESQAAAAVGQISLARIWSETLASYDMTAGQILLTLADTEERRRYLNARATTRKLLEMRAVPIINENDTVATSEIRYGDNDRLAARVATMVGADLLILFSDVDGLYTAPPSIDPAATRIPVVERITAHIEAMAGGAASALSRGGMRTKIEAAKIATAGGTQMVIADGRPDHPVRRIADRGECTWFLSPSNPTTARKTWIAGSLEPRGILYVDDGAVGAMRAGASLLPVGVTRVEGDFARGDAVTIRGKAEIVGRGLVAFDMRDAHRILGRPSREIEAILGYPGQEMVHRDDLALFYDRRGDEPDGAR